ncbi:hypothetical protein Ancab_014356 [Ancistrocladus abbreviatus]
MEEIIFGRKEILFFIYIQLLGKGHRRRIKKDSTSRFRMQRRRARESSFIGLSELGGLEIGSFLEETVLVILQNHLNRRISKAIGDREHDLLHLRSEFLEIDGAALVEVKFLEDGVVKLRELLRRRRLVDAKVLLY